MNFKSFIFLICSFLIAFSVNLMPSIKYPDTSMSTFNLFVTILFLSALLIFIKKASYSGKSLKGLKVFLIIGLLSGLVVYVLKTFEDTMMEYSILDMILSVQYPLYLLFTTPLFGVNYLLDISYEAFSLLMSTVYVLVFFFVISFTKVEI